MMAVPDSSLERAFRLAAMHVSSPPLSSPTSSSSKPLQKAFSNETKLRLYGLYKYITAGDFDRVIKETKASSPGFFDFVGKAKWEAWRRTSVEFGTVGDKLNADVLENNLGNLSVCTGDQARENAMRTYLNLATDLGWVPFMNGDLVAAAVDMVLKTDEEVFQEEGCIEELIMTSDEEEADTCTQTQKRASGPNVSKGMVYVSTLNYECNEGSFNEKNYEEGHDVITRAIKGSDLATLSANLATCDPASNTHECGDLKTTYFHMATSLIEPSIPILDLLLTKYSHLLNHQDTNGQTPLHYAVICNHLNVCRFLLNNGADCLIRDSDGCTASEVCDDSELQALLAKYNT